MSVSYLGKDLQPNTENRKPIGVAGMAAKLLVSPPIYSKGKILLMKILLITPYFPPEVGSAAHLYYELGQALRERGHEITILTGLPRYHVAGKQKDYRQSPCIYETYHGLKVLRVFNLDIPWNIPITPGNGPICLRPLCRHGRGLAAGL